MNSLSFFLILVCFIPSPTHSIPTLPITSHTLTLTYGVNYCKVNTCNGAKINFQRLTIHGLWPNPQTDCDVNSQLKSSDLSQPIITELKTYWPSIKNYQKKGQPLNFWSYEWRKHGTCTWFNKFGYFRRTLDLYYFVNPRLLLAKFPPSNTVRYTEIDIMNYYTLRNLPTPELSCHMMGNDNLLVEIKYCFNATANGMIGCRSGSTSCAAGFYIYPM